MSAAWKDQALSRFMAMVVRGLGPYRIWRVFHSWAARHPTEAYNLMEYIFHAELPAKWLRHDFLAAWLKSEETIAIMRHQSVRLDSPFYALLVFRQVLHACLEQNLIPRRVLEIGPGVHLGAAFCFAAMGAERVAVADIARIVPEPEFYEQLKSLLAVAGGFTWWRYNAAVNPHKAISYPNVADNVCAEDILRQVQIAAGVSAESLPFGSESFDLVYSFNAFEHFPKPQDSVKELARVLEHGGLAVIEVDLRYHCDMREHAPEDALKFLEWSEDEWCRRSEMYSAERALKGCLRGEWGREVYCNRVRWREWLRHFREAGLQVLKEEPVEVLSAEKIDRDKYVEPYRSMSPDDLSVLVGRLIARKP